MINSYSTIGIRVLTRPHAMAIMQPSQRTIANGVERGANTKAAEATPKRA